MEKELFDHIHWVERYLRENRYTRTSSARFTAGARYDSNPQEPIERAIDLDRQCFCRFLMKK